MKFGILLTAYACEDTLRRCLEPWIKLQFPISAVSVPFEEYKDVEQNNEATTEILIEEGLGIFEPKFIKEHEARNLALSKLLESNVDYIWLLDGDEIYTEEQIKRIIEFVEAHEDICWFSIPFKNFVFDENQYVEGFCPPRIFHTNYQNCKLLKAYWDNDFLYSYKDSEISYKQLSTLSIPKKISNIKHLTWLNNERSKKKVEYQMKHFKGVCSYAWNKAENKLEFNQDYYFSRSLLPPKIIRDTP